jgi:hypothetical protein
MSITLLHTLLLIQGVTILILVGLAYALTELIGNPSYNLKSPDEDDTGYF